MNNFNLIETCEMAHIGAVGHLYHHASGARVVYLKSDDTNKVFSVTFKTPPADNTGIAHIMEHCVLAGSKKYPLKDPFMQLANGSLYTFLNAFTYPDKTVYPIASVNDKDFLNLMDVYLDAVFFPAVYDRKHSLLQEGWHYQFDEETGKLKYNGVVYNEMKGAYSDPYRLLFNVLDREMYPDTPYARESGGNPDNIPEIDYEYFIDFHKKYYRPENAFIFLYGDMDIEHCFEKIDKEYLSKFEKCGEGLGDIEITSARALPAPAFAACEYSVADEDELDDNYMAMAYALPVDMPQIDVAAMKVLNYVLMSTPASPLYKAMVESEIGEDISSSFSKDILHPSFGVSLINGTLASQELKDFVEKALTDIVKNGISADFVTACLNYLEFQTKEEDYGANTPKGLVYNLRTLSNWLYGQNPWEPLMGALHLEQIRANCAQKGYLEGLIEKYLLNNNHSAHVMLTPVLDLDEKREEAEREKLDSIEKGLTEAEKAEIIQNVKDLKAFQEAPDTEELLALIPRLSVSDIKKEIERTPLQPCDEDTDEGIVKILHSPLETNDIIYTTMMFDITGIPDEDMPVANVLQYMLSKVATENYDTTGITQEIKGNLGGLGFSIDVATKSSVNDYTPYALVSTKCLSKNSGKMLEIVMEIIKESTFKDRSQIKNYLLEMKASMEDYFLTSGSSAALMRSLSYFSPAAAFQEAVSGLGFYDYLKDLCDNYEERFDSFKMDLDCVRRSMYNMSNVRFNVVANEKLYSEFRSGLLKFSQNTCYHLEFKSPPPAIIVPKNEGLLTASKVQYCAMSANYFKDGFKYNGELKVLGNIL
ncbi:MAG: insulinase family protein, partial [Defluviitaleaceae bacterium]|nr:insulinase family protein [Defluviitaleaceae bacterium]